jgi:hypothetical protein
VLVPWTPETYLHSVGSWRIRRVASFGAKTLHNVEGLDFNTLNQLLLGDLKSAGQVLDNARQFDFGETEHECEHPAG